jgi:hypothetical protein
LTGLDYAAFTEAGVLYNNKVDLTNVIFKSLKDLSFHVEAFQVSNRRRRRRRTRRDDDDDDDLAVGERTRDQYASPYPFVVAIPSHSLTHSLTN